MLTKRIIPNYNIKEIAYALYLLKFRKLDFAKLSKEINENPQNNNTIEKSKVVLDVIRDMYKVNTQIFNHPFQNFIENFFKEKYQNIDLNTLKTNFIRSKKDFL